MNKFSLPKTLKFVCSVALFTTTSTCAQANMVSNGSFETTTLTTSGAFASNVADWSNANNSGELLIFPGAGLAPVYTYSHPDYQAPWYAGTPYPTYGLLGSFPLTSPDGGKYVLSDGDFLHQPISQTITGLTAGKEYQLSFYQALAQLDENLTAPGAVSGYWQVSLGTDVQNSQNMTADGSIPTISPWSQQTMTFQATGATEVLSFFSVGAGLPPMEGLDGVNLTEIPEPGDFAIMLVGFIGIALSIRKHHKTTAV